MKIRSHPLVSGLAALLYLAMSASAEQYILELSPNADAAQVAARHSLILLRPLTHDGRTVYLVAGPEPQPPNFVKDVLADPKVWEFEADERVDSSEKPLTPSPPAVNVAALAGAIQNRAPLQYFGSTVRAGYVQQPAASLIELPDALARFASGRGTVAVIDTGVDPTHPALQGVLVPGYDFTRDQPGDASEWPDLNQSTVTILDQSKTAILDSKRYPLKLNDWTVALLDQSTVTILDGSKLPSDFGHGTMVAGLIHLVAPTARIMPLKAFKADGTAQLSDIVRAVYYAVDNHAQVINMSFSSVTSSASLTEAMQYAWSHNVICIASAGNEGKKLMVYPAGDPGVIGVASTNALDRRSAFSNFDVKSARTAAPGEALITTYPGNNYAGVWGTSFSAALTSGAVALFTQVRPQMRPSKVADALEHGHKLHDDDVGDARLDVLTSLLYCVLDW